MPDDKLPGWGAVVDPLTIGSKFAGLEPVRRRRGDGAVHESKTLGRLQFVWMPAGRPSFWHGALPGADGGTELKLVCEVEGDEPPGADHAACVVAIRRRQRKDAEACIGLVRARLRTMQSPLEPEASDLQLVGIHLPPKPMIAARQVLEFRIAAAPALLFLAVFVHGRPSAVHVDSDA
jgi:hypothetical protein